LEPKSLIQIITEDEFLPMVQEYCTGLFRIGNTFSEIMGQEKDVSRKFYSTLIHEADSLESFLDEHGARENRRWFYFTEYVASIRNLGIAAFFIRHLMDRYPYYNLRETPELVESFSRDSDRALGFLNRSIMNLLKETWSTGKRNGLEPVNDQITSHEIADIEANKRLPRNISQDEVKGEEDRIVDLCEKVKSVSRLMTRENIDLAQDLDSLKKLVPYKMDEKKARMLANQVHSVQSDFDTYVKNTMIEQSHEGLKKIRGYVSLPLHLLEVVLWLCHFYERHEDEIRHGECKRKISMMVDKNELLNTIVNYGFHFSLHFIREGERIADEIYAQFQKIVRVELPIPKPLGFHARPSTYISLIAREHNCDLFLIVDGEQYNAKSVMSLLQAGGAIADKGLEAVTFEGDKRAIDDLKILARQNYCEDKKIPQELSYLRALKDTA